MTGHQRRFVRTIGIDYSGAETADSSLKGLRVYETRHDVTCVEVPPPTGSKKYWTRRGLAAWLIDELDGRVPTIVGIDHAFSFPIRYFERHRLEPGWPSFLQDFCAHWPTDRPHTYVDFIRNGSVGRGTERTGERHWRRLTEEATGSAKSVFHFDVQGSVAKSTHSGLPWLRRIRTSRPDLHIWPFDGWLPKMGATVIVEAYSRLWRSSYPEEDLTPDQHNAYVIARWLQDADLSGALEAALAPPEPGSVATTALVEGWIIGAAWPPRSRKAPRKSRSRSAKPKTTQPGFVNRNNQEVIRRTSEPGNDHNQVLYVLCCMKCGERYGANGSDIFQRRCPQCGGGRPGLAWRSPR